MVEKESRSENFGPPQRKWEFGPQMSVRNRVNQAAELEIYRVNQPFSGAKIRPGYKVVTGGLRRRISLHLIILPTAAGPT
jgi:hypothetical protein